MQERERDLPGVHRRRPEHEEEFNACTNTSTWGSVEAPGSSMPDVMSHPGGPKYLAATTGGARMP